MKKRMIALLIAVLMLAALLPAAALAATPNTCPNCGKGYNEGWHTRAGAESHNYSCDSCGYQEFKYHNHAAVCEYDGYATPCKRTYSMIEGTNTHINKCIASADGSCLHGYGGEGKVESCAFESADDIYCFMTGDWLTCACGRTYEPNPDNHDTDMISTPDGHYEKCRYCPYESELEPHNFVNNECDVCYYRQLILIEKIEIAGIIPPVAGEMPQTNVASLTPGVYVEHIRWARYDAEHGLTGEYSNGDYVIDVPFREGETYLFGIELGAQYGYYFDPEKTKIVYNGKEIPLADAYEDVVWPSTCGMIVDDDSADVFIHMGDLVEDDYSTEKFILKGYELGKSALEISLTESYQDFLIAGEGSYFAILPDVNGLPDIMGNGHNGPFEANTPYWLAIGVAREMQPCALTPAGEDGEDTNPLAGLSEEELQDLRDWAKEFDLNVDYTDSILFPIEYSEYGALDYLLFFRLVPLQAAPASGHQHSFFCWNTDEQGHWPVCYCGITIGLKEEHIFGDDNICDVCGYVRPVVTPVVPELPQTGDASYTALYMAMAGMAAILLCALLKKRA